ncbi:hypothetical protein V5799_029169, partial [Amblyomma americanum]
MNTPSVLFVFFTNGTFQLCLSSAGVLGLLYRGPYFTLEPPALVEFTNQTGVEVRCQADGSPKPSLRWETAAGVRVSTDGTLTLRPFLPEAYRQAEHSAFYRCVATNVLGSIASRPVHVLGAEERYSVLETGELVIHRTNMADSERTYRCRVRNTVSGSTVLSIKAGRAIVVDVGDRVAPRLTLFRKTIKASVGRTVNLPCVVAAFPPANVTWYRQQRRQLEPLMNAAGIRQVNGILTFEEVKLENDGMYICIAGNDVAEIRAEATLVVT